MAKTLLLADDSVTIQKVVSISFASEDVTLVTVDNGDDAIDRAKETRPDLILADVVMPGKSGYEVCEAIKADPELRHIPVLLLSGTFEAFDEERAAQAGAAGHVAKPFEAQSLVDKVNGLLANTPAPVVAASPVAAPEAAAVPVAATPVDSFDFFDDDFDELDTPLPESTDEVADLELSDSEFAMGEDDLTPLETTPEPQAESGYVGGGEPFPDRTLAIMPDDADSDGAVEIPPTAVSSAMISDAPEVGVGELVATVEEEAEDSFMTADPSSIADEAFDFSFESESTAPESIEVQDVAVENEAAEENELVEATVLDPVGAVGFDVDPMADVDAEAGEESPFADVEELADATRVAGDGVGYEEVFAPAELEIAPEPTVADTAEPEWAAHPTELPEPVADSPVPDDASAARAEAVLAEISPELREVMHDTLEKIAWEAFGDVTDKIVREVVDRVEKVAWEVVPQLTETLIKAEIQRLKDGSED